jgi:hypothetical protein
MSTPHRSDSLLDPIEHRGHSMMPALRLTLCVACIAVVGSLVACDTTIGDMWRVFRVTSLANFAGAAHRQNPYVTNEVTCVVSQASARVQAGDALYANSGDGTVTNRKPASNYRSSSYAAQRLHPTCNAVWMKFNQTHVASSPLPGHETRSTVEFQVPPATRIVDALSASSQADALCLVDGLGRIFLLLCSLAHGCVFSDATYAGRTDMAEPCRLSIEAEVPIAFVRSAVGTETRVWVQTQYGAPFTASLTTFTDINFETYVERGTSVTDADSITIFAVQHEAGSIRRYALRLLTSFATLEVFQVSAGICEACAAGIAGLIDPAQRTLLLRDGRIVSEHGRVLGGVRTQLGDTVVIPSQSSHLGHAVVLALSAVTRTQSSSSICGLRVAIPFHPDDLGTEQHVVVRDLPARNGASIGAAACDNTVVITTDGQAIVAATNADLTYTGTATSDAAPDETVSVRFALPVDSRA